MIQFAIIVLKCCSEPYLTNRWHTGSLCFFILPQFYQHLNCIVSFQIVRIERHLWLWDCSKWHVCHEQRCQNYQFLGHIIIQQMKQSTLKQIRNKFNEKFSVTGLVRSFLCLASVLILYVRTFWHFHVAFFVCLMLYFLLTFCIDWSFICIQSTFLFMNPLSINIY